jgi:glucose-6-phosphate isomerase
MARYEDAAWRDGMRVRFDFNNLMADSVGPAHGIDAADIDRSVSRCREAHASLQAKRAAGELEWMDLPYQKDNASRITAFAEKARARFSDFAVLGIGGSALGPIAVQAALRHPFYNLLPADKRGGPRIFVLDNVDPDFIDGFLDAVDIEHTLFNVITKSGSTAETMSQLLVFGDLLKRRLGSRYADNIVATTDPKGGDLRKLVQSEGYASFEIPPKVGGRFSELSSVGLLAAAMSGIDVSELLAGAAYADQYCREPDVWKNPAYVNALAQFMLYERGKHVSVLMPYSQALRYVADWYRQLWAESLGKKHDLGGRVINVGPTPVSALGVTDQHSMLQLFMEGPHDKVLNFISVEHFDHEVTIPAGLPGVSSAEYLGGQSLNTLIAAEQRGVELALTAEQRPNCRHIVPEINAFTVGQLLYLFEIQTAFAGELFEINAFDQPGVEGGKIATYALMGRAGFEKQKKDIESLPGANPRYVI